jgi:RHS repeat-associated protein
VYVSSDAGVSDAKIYSGSATGTPLREYQIAIGGDADPYADDACYNEAGNIVPPLVSQAVGTRISQIKTILEDGQTQSQKQYDYDSFTYVYHPNHCTYVLSGNDSNVAVTYTTSRGNVTEIRDYDWGSGAPGPLIRKTDNVYGKNTDPNYLSRNIVDKITQQTIYDGSGSQIAQTQYEVDNYVAGTNGLISSSSTAAQHDDTNFPSTFTYRGNVTRVKRWRNTDSALLTTIYTYDDLGNIRAITDPLTHTSSYSNADSFANTSCPPTVGKTGQAYVTQLTNALSQNIQFKYFPCTGLKQARKDQNDINASRTGTTQTYDLLGRKGLTQFPDGGQTTNSYIDSSASTVTTTVLITNTPTTLNQVSTAILDGIGRPIQSQLTAPEGTLFVDTTYDALGRVSTVSNPHRASTLPTDGTTTTQYDSLSRVIKMIPPDGTSTSDNVTTSYAGNCTTVTDQAGKARKSCSDGLGRLTQVFEDPTSLNYLTAYSYDVLGSLKNVSQAGSRTRTFIYNSLSQLLTAANPESGTTTYTYDNNGNVQTKTDARAIKTTYSYDALNRLTGKTYSDGTTASATYAYDQSAPWGTTLSNYIGRLTTEYTSNSSGTLTDNLYNYDPLGRVIWRGQCQPLNCALSSQYAMYTYNLIGSPTSLRTVQTGVLDFTISYGYDSADRLTSVASTFVDAQHPATLFTIDPTTGYAPGGELVKALYGNGLTHSAQYTSRRQPCRLNIKSSSAPFVACTDPIPAGNVQDFTYGFNLGTSDNGNVTSFVGAGNQIFNRSYSYDSLNRLGSLSETATAQLCKGLSWGYDAWGNRTDQTVTGGTCNTFHNAVDTNNRFVGTPYQYDAAGNMTHDASHSYTYDAENRLTAVDGGATATYLYNAEGQRVQRSVGAWRDYIYDTSGQVLAETTASGWQVGYVYTAGQFIAQYRDSTTYFVHHDHLGSTRLLTKMDQTPFDSLDYLPFGEQISGDTGTTHKFTGKERDSESGLDNFGARYYSSSMGRWATPDWAAKPSAVPYAMFGNPQSLNLYSYVGNNPLLHFDPDGHCWPVSACARAAMAKVNQAQQYVQNKATATGNPAVAATATFVSGVTRDVVNGVMSVGTMGSATGACMGGNGCSPGKTALAVGGDLLKAAAIAAPAMGAVAGAGGAAASETTATMQLFRAVGSAEVDSIAETGAFFASPTGSMSKGFFFNESDAQSFADMATERFGDPHSVVSTEAPTDLVNSSAPHSAASEGPGVYIQNENLNQLTPLKKPD